eukprot:1135785-Amphidinium_carterae.1
MTRSDKHAGHSVPLDNLTVQLVQRLVVERKSATHDLNTKLASKCLPIDKLCDCMPLEANAGYASLCCEWSQSSVLAEDGKA